MKLEYVWHALPIEKVFEILKTRKEGLTQEEAKERLSLYGFNEIEKEKEKSVLLLFVQQFNNPLILLLIVATLFSALIGEVLDAAVILVVVLASAGLGFVEEYRSEKAIQLLKKLTLPETHVIRNGKETSIPTREVVVGDIIILRSGDRVPADLRLIETFNLRIDESSLTGESIPVEKFATILSADTLLFDRVNMAYSGTLVTYGRGTGVVVATGMNTEFGKVAKIVQAEEEVETPLERRMNTIGKWLIAFSLSVCGVVAFLGILRGNPLIEMILWGISLAVAAVPEALPAVVTGSLAIGMYEMAKRKAIVKRLPAVETLGCTSVICSDKTGTMTKGEMTVKKIYVSGKFFDVSGSGYEPKGSFYFYNEKVDLNQERDLYLLLKFAALCNDAKLIYENKVWRIIGDTTEGALVVAARKAGITEEELNVYKRVNEIQFTSERKRMTTIHVAPEGEKLVAIMKGAPEVVVTKCNYVIENGNIKILTEEKMAEILKVNENMAEVGLRNIAVAYKEEKKLPEELNEEEFERNFIFLGVLGILDPPREEVKEAIQLCKDAGIDVVMITGDHKLTAETIAKELNLVGDENNIVLTGADLEKIDEVELSKIAEKVKIYARVSPEHKMKIVAALKRKGHIVAMTGDGINDAPALKMADIGVAMGITGTEVTKETADVVLADDNFATIVSAVKEGRRIFDNIKKYLTYLLRCNIAEILFMLVSTLIGLPLPLTAVQLLWVNLTTDGLPAIALGIEPAEEDVMKRKPRSLKESIFTKKDVLLYFIFIPAMITLFLLSLFLWSLSNESLIEARTQALTAMILIELLMAISSHSLSKPIIKAKPFSNKFLWYAVFSSLLLQLLILYIPFLHPAFDVTYPSAQDWLLAILSSLVVFATVEFFKAFS
ncbi:MAG: cation-translocating P-type ATPase [Thermoproteota archaeon]